MAALKNKIDFVALISVTNANGNGDPLNGKDLGQRVRTFSVTH